MRALLRWLALVLCALLALQLFFVLRIAAMAVLDPQSTTFQRSEAWALATGETPFAWRQQWVPYDQISEHLKRAVIAAEDDGFALHAGVDWQAMERAWQRNARLAAQPERLNARAPRIRGGSTITQQLAKNLLLSGERTLVRKGQEMLLTFLLERLLTKQRILEIYLNNVEWGSGIFGAEAAARHYHRKSARQLGPAEAARLAVMLPAPKRFEQQPGSAYLTGRTRLILGRMRSAQLP
ncbi:monofunctional biosynthetic peptidoglycan transglycosylase [Oryzisolibacter propanilivorax]|uniref:Biosynthetic peptidoglycan transglycosylase n=1 Tax=Oryzisolibacter propanilivorax TaxID=1527607 RepID=A0A1G9RNL2_9BURK|nr:monofunctional biosynthetic peptidoglycan transglycosylase [Oryzisolibacter propanilivorax]SDM24822.1 monofunctional biosynthetic peptidoglycan transglycosylase [Oryzisolibacter propanilivorax]